ncbi:hypothetical protein LJ707_13690 [Mucilaginibacter sp. UR6-1]|uniref:hypothetical protein n=1 Tax=Mucilaginibacter sp. UR6-1 TaxID=1435643 RepID=UPI001E53CCAC|nr:hypothetical protein [Mucilaginibacter sp. UR6-1]MCC8409985.1 hypothetical protein [Mucilaginibacter sp. UR6-1]
MKKLILVMAVTVMALTQSIAQNKADSLQGYWVIESNVKTPKLNTVKFYNDNHHLVYQETVNAKIKLSDKKVQKALNKILTVMVNQRRYTADQELLSIYLAKQ